MSEAEPVSLPRRSVGDEEMVSGRTFLTTGRTITETDLATYAGLSGDFDGPHVDDTAAVSIGFERRIAQGPLLVVFLNGLLWQSGLLHGRDIFFLGVSSDVLRPVQVGSTVSARLTVQGVRKTRSDPSRAVLTLSYEMLDVANGEVVAQGVWKEMVRAR